jgi:hypothetical protein
MRHLQEFPLNESSSNPLEYTLSEILEGKKHWEFFRDYIESLDCHSRESERIRGIILGLMDQGKREWDSEWREAMEGKDSDYMDPSVEYFQIESDQSMITDVLDTIDDQAYDGEYKESGGDDDEDEDDVVNVEVEDVEDFYADFIWSDDNSYFISRDPMYTLVYSSARTPQLNQMYEESSNKEEFVKKFLGNIGNWERLKDVKEYCESLWNGIQEFGDGDKLIQASDWGF